LTLPEADAPVSLTTKLGWEKELLGIYVSGHPLDAHKEKTMKAHVTIASIMEEVRPGLPVILPVLISEVRQVLTKKGDKMAFLKLEDKTGSIESVIFPKLYIEQGKSFVAGSCVLIKGTVSNRNGEVSLTIENAKPL
jgi:DNA polymerase-3 subunit alpha